MKEITTDIPAPKPIGKFIKLFFVLNLVVLTIIMVIAMSVLFQKSKFTVKSGEAVVTQLRSLNRYETASFTIEQIIEAGTNGNQFQQLLFGDRILLIANGEVIGGFDLSKLSDNDIKIDGSSVTLNLPAPQILITRLDNDKTRVYDRTEGFLTHGNKDLESTARLSAEEQIRTAACSEKILDKASSNARTQLTTILKALGFTTVTINIPAGSC